MKNCTSIEQSKKLAEILPLESADMTFCGKYNVITTPYLDSKGSQLTYFMKDEDITPCWSLAALLELLELPTLLKDSIGKGKTGWMVIHYDVNGMRYDSNYFDNPIDACYEMIVTLKEKGLM